MSRTQSGTLLIADITGYTLFLSESELEHAQEILSTLLELLMNQTRPPFIISRTAGDAVISYALGASSIQGQTFVELLEDTYIAFRRAIELMVLNNTCKCAACANVAALDLKFFVHYGVFGVQRLGGHDELVGSDVNQLHRLLKNHIVESTGIRAYTVYTAAAVDALGLAEIAAAMTPHAEQYEHLGVVDLFVQDMAPVWATRRESAGVDIPPEQVLVSVERTFQLPPHILWDALSRPEYRAPLLGAVSQTIGHRQAGRIGPGTEIHCDHGNRTTRQRILTWRPFELMVSEDTTPVPGTTCLVRLRLSPTSAGTRLEFALSRGRGNPIGRRLMNFVGRRTIPDTLTDGLATLERQLSAEYLNRSPD
jgi:uncharacterized protein YndB with AHSA1/START domain